MQALSDIPLEGYQEHMGRLEHLLAESVSTSDPVLSDVATHLIRAGGKRVRPTLSIAGAASGGANIDDSVLLAGVAVELVHLASLYHDDVMDDATSRRGAPSVNSKWGNLVAIVVGDFLLARAAGIAARLGQDVAELLADTLARLCEGQILEVNSTFKTERTVDQYFDAIAGKTASLMATSAKIGALAAGIDRDAAARLERIGYLFGMVYQIRDDVLDIVGTSDMLGKAPAQDLIEGVYTLPAIYALEQAGGQGQLVAILGQGRLRGITPAELAIARREIVVSGALEKSLSVAREFSAEAEQIAAEVTGPVASYLGSLSARLLKGIDAVIEERLSSELAS
ncbi:MAG: polyprenyl synthetase family protein [Nitrospiraceae bacterium]|nr:polyprenyl synthetase family protein [Nitrospiraceae bacterium]